MTDNRFITCPECDGEGRELVTIEVFEPGCGFSHSDAVYGDACETCRGEGVVEAEVEPATLEDREDA